MRRTIAAAKNLHGWPQDGIPAIIGLIFFLLEQKQINAFSTFNDVPMVDVSDVRTNPANWYLTSADAELVVRALADGKAAHDIEDERNAAWWNETLDATAWWNQDSVKFNEAAMLLCLKDPRKTTEAKAECGTVDDDTSADGKVREITPVDFKRLRDAFDANVHKGADRKLEYWLALAKSKSLRYHGWIDQWLSANGIVLPAHDRTRPPQGLGKVAALPANVVHSTKPIRRNVLTSVIELAQSQCKNPQYASEVWAKLLVLAEKKEPPFIGTAEEGLKYYKGASVAFLSRDALGKRLRRQLPQSTAKH